jgi:hypothetical protein
MTLLDDTPPSASASSTRGDVAPRVGRALLIAAAAIALLIHIPGLRTPLLLDDFTQLAMIEGRYPSPPGPFQLYDFIDDSNRAILVDRGVLPWWSHPKMVMRFLRPLSSALLWMDYRIAGDRPLWGHLHSLLWWAAACLAVHLLLRRLFSPRVAWLGVVVFALAPCHSFPLSWLANREEIISTALGTAALVVYLRWREWKKPRDGLLCLTLFSLAALAGEYTLCFAGYVIAAEMVVRGESVSRRVMALGCFAVPMLAYVAVHHALHYGAFGIGYYHDPLRDPGAYAGSAPRRLTVLLTTAWLGLNELVWVNEPGWKLVLVTIAAVGCLAVPLTRMLRELDVAQRRGAWAMLVGSVLSLAPVMAVEPSARLLQVPMVGVSAVVALLVDHVWFPRSARPRRGAAEFTELVVLGLAFVHFFRAPLDTWLSQRATRSWAANFEGRLASLSEQVDRSPMVVILRANSSQAIFFSPLRVEDPSARVRTLSLRSGKCLVLRTSARAFDMVAAPPGLFPIGPGDLLRDIPIRQGDRAELPGMRVTILELHEDGAPRRARFEFDRDLDDPSMVWLIDASSGFREQKLPAVGYGATLEL